MNFLSKEVQLNYDLDDLNYNPRNEEFFFSTQELSQIYYPKNTDVKGIVIVAHGLNLIPSKMNSLISLILDNGLIVLRLSLAGHRGSVEEFKQVNAAIWQNQFQTAVKISHRMNLPFYFLGYSLGALVGMEYFSRVSDLKLKKILLISPAISIHWYIKILNLLVFFPKKMMIPSGNLKEYRLYNGTSVSAYLAMLQLLKLLNKNFANVYKYQTLIFSDPKDELVSWRGLRKLVLRSLNKWELIELNNNQSTLSKTYHHLVIDPASLGPGQWQMIQKVMSNFFT